MQKIKLLRDRSKKIYRIRTFIIILKIKFKKANAPPDNIFKVNFRIRTFYLLL